MKVRKAVIVAAGLGTRMLPFSKVVPKELLPVVDTPAIQLVVEEAARSGIEEIIFVISPGRTLAVEHLQRDPALESHLAERGKTELLKRLDRITKLNVKFTVVEQTVPLGLGHAVLCAREAVGGETFAAMLPDDIFDGDKPCLLQLMEVAERESAPVIALLKVAPSEVSKYGIVAVQPGGNRMHRIVAMVEKPAPENAPSDLAVMGRYILPPEIFAMLADGRPGTGGEIQLTDSLAALARGGPFYGYEFEGTRHDLGDPLGFLTAQVDFGLKRADLADRFRAYLKSVISS